MGFFGALSRQRLQYVHGDGGRSCPSAQNFGRLGFAISERAIETPSQALEFIAERILEAVCQPPVEITGILTAALIARASSSPTPSIGRPRFMRNQAQ